MAPTASSQQKFWALLQVSPNATLLTSRLPTRRHFYPTPIARREKFGHHSFTQANLFTTICKSGYTQRCGRSVSYTNNLKKQQIIDYGYQDTKYERL